MGQNPSRLDQFGGSSGFSHSSTTTTSTAVTTATTASTNTSSLTPLAPPAPLSAPLPNPPTHLAPPAPLSAPLPSTLLHPRLHPPNPPNPCRPPLLPVQPNGPRVDPTSTSASGPTSRHGHGASSASKKLGRKLSLKRRQGDEKPDFTPVSLPPSSSLKALRTLGHLDPKTLESDLRTFEALVQAAETRAGLLHTSNPASTPPPASSSSPPSSPRKLSRANFSRKSKSIATERVERVERVDGDHSGSPSIPSEGITSASTPFPLHFASTSHSVTPLTLANQKAPPPTVSAAASPAITSFRAGSTSPRSSRFSSKSARRAEREWRARVAAISASAGKRSPSFGPTEGVRGPVPPRRHFATVPKTERGTGAGARAGVAYEAASIGSGGDSASSGLGSGSGSRSSRSPSPAPTKGQGLSGGLTPDGSTPDSKVGTRDGLPITPPSPPGDWAHLHNTSFASNNSFEIPEHGHDMSPPTPLRGQYTIPLADDNGSPRVWHNRPRSRKVSVPSSISSYYFDQAGMGAGVGAAVSRPSSLAVSTLFAIPQGEDSSEENSSEGDKSREMPDSRGGKATREETDLRDVEPEQQGEEGPCLPCRSAHNSGNTHTHTHTESSASQTRAILEASLDDTSHAPTPITSTSTVSSSEASFGDFEPGSKYLWSAPFLTPTTLHVGPDPGFSTSASNPLPNPPQAEAQVREDISPGRPSTPLCSTRLAKLIPDGTTVGDSYPSSSDGQRSSTPKTVIDQGTPTRLPIPRTSPNRISQRKPVGLALDAAALNPVSEASRRFIAQMDLSPRTILQSGKMVAPVQQSRGERESKGRHENTTLRMGSTTATATEPESESESASASATTPSRLAPKIASTPNTPCSPMTAWILSAPSVNLGLGMDKDMDLGLDVEPDADADADGGRSSPTQSAMSVHPFAMAGQEVADSRTSRASPISRGSTPRTLPSTSGDPIRRSKPLHPEPAGSTRPHMLGSVSVADEYVDRLDPASTRTRTELSTNPRARSPGDGPTLSLPPLFPDLITSSSASLSKSTAISLPVKPHKSQGSGTAPRRPFPLAPGHPLRQRLPSNGTATVRSPTRSPTLTRTPTLTPACIPNASSSASKYVSGLAHVSPFRRDMLGTSPLRVPMRKLDLTPGMGLGEVERPPKSGMPMRDLNRWLEETSTSTSPSMV